jgi:uncharacterized protein (TIGR00299 family) protein
MNILYVDTIAGISGDMTLGAMIAAGVSVDDLRTEIAKLGLKGVEIDARHVKRNGITAVKVDVVISAPSDHHRHLKDIVAIIDGSGLASRVKDNAKKIFLEVAKAESAVHGIAMEKVHFHEVGALDSIVDIVGCAIGLELLGIDRVYTSPVKLGSGGFVDTQHGKLPLPGPATMEILKGYPVVLTDIPFELTTPTGAAIVKAMSSGVIASEKLRVNAIGYGSGTHEIPLVPNLLRLMVGEMIDETERDELLIIETNIDNMNPEIYPYVMEKMMEAGAHDVCLVPVVMKKGRSGILLSAMVDRENEEKVTEVLFRETTTLGVRIYPVQRRKLRREEIEFLSSFGVIRGKSVVRSWGRRVMPEFEECRRISRERNIPLGEVYRILEKEMNS